MDGDPATGLLERNPWVTRRKFDVGEYYRLAEAGILREDDRVERIEGEIVQMVPIGSGHRGTVAALTYVFMQAAGARAAGNTLEAALLPGLRVAVADILGQSVIAGGGITEGVNHATRQARP